MRQTVLYLTLVVCLLLLQACGKKADENKPVSQMQAEAEKMDANKLKSMAMAYQDAIVAKKADVEKLAAKLKEIPLTEMLGEKAKQLKADIENVNKSISSLKERFQIYYNKLKEKGGDLSGLGVG